MVVTINSTTMGINMEVLQKKTIEFPNNSALSLLGVYPKGIKFSVKQRYIPHAYHGTRNNNAYGTSVSVHHWMNE